jgi:UDP-N-acetylmuramate dehydrogenase
MRDERNYNLLKHNTFGIEACCQRFLEYSNLNEAVAVARLLREEPQPFMMTGAGSNLLLTRDYAGTMVHSAIKGFSLTEQPDGQATLRCGSGETWDDIVAWTAELGFFDLVNLSLIPGEAGASAVQNIGAYGTEAEQSIESIQAVDLTTETVIRIAKEECHYGYRDSRFKHEWRNRFLITHVNYMLNRRSQPNTAYGNIRAELERLGISSPTPLQLRQAIIGIRRAKLPDPQELGNAGSFFVNPIVSRQQFEALAAQYPQMPHYYINETQEKIPAGWLIEQCGWKGRSMGRAGVYEKQALVLVNLGGATGQEIADLCHAIQEDVQRKFGIAIKPEVNLI